MSQVTVEEACRRVLAGLPAKGYAPATIRSYECYARQLSQRFAGRTVASLTADERRATNFNSRSFMRKVCRAAGVATLPIQATGSTAPPEKKRPRLENWDDDRVMAAFADLLKAKLARKGISQGEVARRYGVTPAAVSRWLNGEGMRCAQVLRLVRWLQLDLRRLG